MSKITDLRVTRPKALGWAGALLLSFTVPAVAVDFSGTNVENVFVRTEVATVTINEGGVLIPVPGMTVSPFTVAGGDTDLFVVTFSAQVELQNSSVSNPTFNADDVLDVRIQAVNNATSAVLDFSPSFAAFASSNSPGSHSMTWVRRLETGVWSIRVVARVNDRAPTSVVRALLSARTLVIMRVN